MTWPLEGVLMQQGDGSASGEYAEEAPSWLECRPSPVSLPPARAPISSSLLCPLPSWTGNLFRLFQRPSLSAFEALLLFFSHLFPSTLTVPLVPGIPVYLIFPLVR